jgi:hypothetical protein
MTVEVLVRCRGERAREVRALLDPGGLSEAFAEVTFTVPVPRRQYDEIVEAAAGSEVVADIVIAASAVESLRQDAAARAN